MKVTPIACTTFFEPHHVPWTPDESAHGTSGQDLCEFAGRACYQSWSRPNPKTATNSGYLQHILEVGHESVLEHASVSFYIEGVSRSLTHELIRHRHLSYSQLSQRYVDESNVEFVPPPAIAGDSELLSWWRDTVGETRFDYSVLIAELTQRLPEAKRKQIREAARSVLPNATETKIVVTGNYRAWRHFIKMRASEAADAEIRELAFELLRHLQRIAPNVFRDLGGDNGD